jgi:hypothetical protein
MDDLYGQAPFLLSESDHANHVGRIVLSLKNDPALLADLRAAVRTGHPNHTRVLDSWTRGSPAAAEAPGPTIMAG